MYVVLFFDGFRFSKSQYGEDYVNEVVVEIWCLYDRYVMEKGEIFFDRYL